MGGINGPGGYSVTGYGRPYRRTSGLGIQYNEYEAAEAADVPTRSVGSYEGGGGAGGYGSGYSSAGGYAGARTDMADGYDDDDSDYDLPIVGGYAGDYTENDFSYAGLTDGASKRSWGCSKRI